MSVNVVGKMKYDDLTFTNLSLSKMTPSRSRIRRKRSDQVAFKIICSCVEEIIYNIIVIVTVY